MSPPPRNAPPLTDREFQLFRKLFDERIGLNLAPHKKLLLSGRLGRRVQALDLPSYHAYHDLIASGEDPVELQTAIDLITTHETFFFREIHHFDLLRRMVVPTHGPGRPLRAWSAACSTGEEPYSIAMVLHDTMGPSGWELVASDVSQGTLAKAAAGLYKMERIEGISQEYLRAYCLRGKDQYEGMMLVGSQLRGMVDFRQVNLTSIPPDLGLFDVVFLRNVIIYFDAPTKRHVLESVCDHLRPGGWLMLGHSESLAGYELPLEQVRPSVYRRPA